MSSMAHAPSRRRSPDRFSRRRLLQGGGLALAAGAAQACDAWSVVGNADDRYPGGSPFAIEALRARDYRAGDIRLHRALNQRPSYSTYAMTYRSDELLLTGVATIPKRAGPHPVVVLNHGFTLPVQYRSGDGTRAMAAELSPARVHHARQRLSGARRLRGRHGHESSARGSISPSTCSISSPRSPRCRTPGTSAWAVWGHSLGCDLALRAAEVDARVQPVGMWAPH